MQCNPLPGLHLKAPDEVHEMLSQLNDRRFSWLLAIACGLMLFVSLGSAALFDPDEGRNAERAREILLLHDWAVPHENFLPALDKPVFFYWLIALSYKLFGVSEWSARLPSALAAFACLIVLYRFARSQRGQSEGLASLLILATSLQFFLFARIVIFDMVLTLFIAIALFEFYRAASTEDQRERRWRCLIMYAAMGLATLVKGPVGVALPAVIIFAFLLIERRWRLLGQIHLAGGAVLFCAIVIPAYLWAESESPGYLRYFLWEENVLRFFTPRFQRTEPWYYYAAVLTVGFLPWSVLIPSWIKAHWNSKLGGLDRFLLLWIFVPLLFFSLSDSKMPQYLLPIFPPLAILLAERLLEMIETRGIASSWQLGLPLLMTLGVIFYLVVGTVWPDALPHQIREGVEALTGIIWFAAVVAAAVALIALFGRRRGQWRRPGFLFSCYGSASLICMMLTLPLAAHVAQFKSAKPVVEHLAQYLSPGDRLVHYDGYLTGMLFYLRAQQPTWIVWSGTKPIVMDNKYVASENPAPVEGYGQVLFTYNEFANAARASDRPLKIIVKTKSLNRLLRETDGVAATKVGEFGEYILLTTK
jgi:4-amino-4-deoxy-L-arabinose transferase-like glycosyltransferase